MNKITLLSLVALLASCSTIKSYHQEDLENPWSSIGKGSSSVGMSTGWAFYGAEAEAEGQDILLNNNGTDTTTLTPRYGGALKYSRFITDNVSLGFIYEHRNFEADPVAPLEATLIAEPFSTDHFIISTRYWGSPTGNQRRWIPFSGIDLGYIPEVDFGEVQVDYPAAQNAAGVLDETINIVGSDYWTLAIVAGASYMVRPGLSLDLGAFYEWAITPGSDTLELQSPPGGGADVDVEVWPSGLILFGGLSWYF